MPNLSKQFRKWNIFPILDFSSRDKRLFPPHHCPPFHIKNYSSSFISLSLPLSFNRNCRPFPGRSQHQLESNGKSPRQRWQRARWNHIANWSRRIFQQFILLAGCKEWCRNHLTIRWAFVPFYVCVANIVAIVVWRWMGPCTIYDQGDIGSSMEIRSGH